PTTIEVERDTRPKGFDVLNPLKGNISTSPTKRMLLDPSEVSRINPDEAILRIADGRILKFRKMYYKNHPFAADLEERHISKYMPAWAVEYMRREGLAGWDDGDGAGRGETGQPAVMGQPDVDRSTAGQPDTVQTAGTGQSVKGQGVERQGGRIPGTYTGVFVGEEGSEQEDSRAEGAQQGARHETDGNDSFWG
ncbi:MAG: hypothetical protein K6U74_10200, partial [Firmicutes bacterium]|nr:hypothetical protein [Bacillota bacterium]